MNAKLQYVSFGLGAVLLLGIGLIIDRVGGIGIRSDDVSSPVVLSFSQPLMKGVPLTIRWSGQSQQNLPIAMQLVSASETVSLGSGKLLVGSLRVTIPCALSDSTARLELIDTSTRAILASSAINLLPAGPDCVR